MFCTLEFTHVLTLLIFIPCTRYDHDRHIFPSPAEIQLKAFLSERLNLNKNIRGSIPFGKKKDNHIGETLPDLCFVRHSVNKTLI